MFTQCRNNKQDGASAERSLPLNGIILSVAVFYLCGLGSCSSQDLVKTMKPSEKLTSACGRVLDLDCEAVAVGGSPWDQGATSAPHCGRTHRAGCAPKCPPKAEPTHSRGPHPDGDTTRTLLCFCFFLFSFTMVTTPRSCVLPVTIPRPGWNVVCVDCSLLLSPGTTENRDHLSDPGVYSRLPGGPRAHARPQHVYWRKIPPWQVQREH